MKSHLKGMFSIIPFIEVLEEENLIYGWKKNQKKSMVGKEWLLSGKFYILIGEWITMLYAT